LTATKVIKREGAKMSNGIANTLTLVALALSTALFPTAPPARSVVPEATARASCHAEAKRLKIKVPPGACEDPRSRLKFLTKAREMCAKGASVASGQVKCTGTVVKD
jgi:hypothetical protein